MFESIRQEVSIGAPPQLVYEALLDSKQHEEFTGNGACNISREEGGTISCHGGQVIGRNVELLKNRRIVQAWRFKNWEDGVYSIVRFELHENSGGTRLVLDHTGVPAADRDHVDAGWHKMYWEKLRKYFASR
jgi:activator of HSP90 ATPase